MSGAPRSLVATTRRVDADLDLAAVAGQRGFLFERGQRGLAATGVALRIDIPRDDPVKAGATVTDALAGIASDDEVGQPGCGPVAFGALAFDTTRPGQVIVPSLVVGRSDDGTRWRTTITSEPPQLQQTAPSAPVRTSPAANRVIADDFAVRAEIPADQWCDAIRSARDELRAGVAEKVVLARQVTVHASSPIDVSVVVERLRRSYPGCYVFAIEGFVGASPELLIARNGDIIRSHPMAGTAPRSGDPSTDARLAATLLASAKDRYEHRITIDMVHDTLLPWCSYLDEEADPSIVAVANVQHLATLVEGRLSSPPASVMELMTALHPTPAVCGHPRGAALTLIERYEGLDRGRYAGPVGWVDAAGNGEWAVGIRSAEIDGHHARLLAGVGVVADSDPEAELAETQAKLQALLGAIIRP